MASHPKVHLLRAYILDWIFVFILLFAYYGFEKIEPFHRLFSLGDKTIQFPHQDESTVPMWLLLVLSMVAPLIVITIVALAIRRNLHDWHHALLGLFLSFSLTVSLTNLFKIAVGRPRPDFIDRCRPMENSNDSPIYGLSSFTICTRTELLNEGFKSFLSGHASASFAGLGFLSLYLAGKLHVFDKKGYTYKGFVSVAPLTIATFVAISRTMDYLHHWHDVLAGSILGFILAFFAYHQYYPSLHSPISHKPLTVRLKKMKPEYKANFKIYDGSEFQITVTKKDDKVSYNDNGDNKELKIIVTDTDTNNTTVEEIKT